MDFWQSLVTVAMALLHSVLHLLLYLVHYYILMDCWQRFVTSLWLLLCFICYLGAQAGSLTFQPKLQYMMSKNYLKDFFSFWICSETETTWKVNFFGQNLLGIFLESELFIFGRISRRYFFWKVSYFWQNFSEMFFFKVNNILFVQILSEMMEEIDYDRW